MTTEEIERILQGLFQLRTEPIPPPAMSDIDTLENYFSCEFPEDFLRFHSVVWKYWFEGGLLKIAVDGQIDSEDTVVSIYEAEKRIGEWRKDFIPFYDVGNGDYECFSTAAGKISPVFYFRHGNRACSQNYSSFEEWLLDLPNAYS